MNSIQDLANRLAIYLAAYKHYIEIKSKARLLDVTIFGEPLARDLAKIVFGYKDLVNLNLKTSFPAVDLGSLAAECAIQVTITASTTKIVETQQKFFEHKLDSTYSTLKFIILGEKQKTYESKQIVRAQGNFRFDPDQDIYDLGDLFSILVGTGDPAKFEAFYKRLETELGSAIRPYLLGADRPGQNLRALFDTHDVRTTDALQGLKRFGMSRAIYLNNMTLAEVSSKELIKHVSEQFWVSGEWIDGTHDHIYSGGLGEEVDTNWRRSLQGAYDLVKRARTNGEKLELIIPAGLDLLKLDTRKDVVDNKARGYEHFFLVARKVNDFSVEYFRLVISDSLSYQGCRDGIFLIFLAAEIYEIETQQQTYVEVYEAPREEILNCYMGNKFLADLHHSGKLIWNHKDFVYCCAGTALRATQNVPPRLASLLQVNLINFVERHSFSLPTVILLP